MFAVVNIDKPQGMTSHDVVARLRRIYGLKKVGHMGTLDPMATGVLPVCLGQATRLIEYFPTDKAYRAEITLGRTTTTLDAEGDTVSEPGCQGVDLSPERIEAVLSGFRGTIHQQVPLYSAVHVKGKKLYELARQGRTADLPTREVTIHRLERIGAGPLEYAGDGPTLVVEVACSSGTYIRSLARDIGETLGCGAYLSGLARTEHGRFRLADAVSLDTLRDSAQPANYLLNPVDYLDMPALQLDEAETRQLDNGMKIAPPSAGGGVALKLKPNALYLAMHGERPVGVTRYEAGRLRPLKIFPA